MKATIELPDDLLQRVKIIAIQEHRRFKDMIAEVLEVGLAQRTSNNQKYKLPKPLKLRNGFIPTTEDIERAIAEGRR
jgi:predicted transcriptional regulator